MKRSLVATVAVCLALCLVACGGKVKVKSEDESKIASALAIKYNVKVSEVIYSCYGKFDDVYVLCYDAIDFNYPTTLNVDGVVFKFATPRQFDVYKSGKFYTLKEAFDKSWLTHDDLVKVRRNHKAANKNLYK